MDTDENNCLICLDNISKNNFVFPKNCNCKVKLHLQCLDLLHNSGLLCPICRIKKTNSIQIYIINREDPPLMMFPFQLFVTSPNLITFLIFIVFSFLLTIFYIAPMLIIISIHDYAYHRKIIYGVLITIGIYTIKNIIFG